MFGANHLSFYRKVLVIYVGSCDVTFNGPIQYLSKIYSYCDLKYTRNVLQLVLMFFKTLKDRNQLNVLSSKILITQFEFIASYHFKVSMKKYILHSVSWHVQCYQSIQSKQI